LLEKLNKPCIYYITSIVFIVLGLGYFFACLTQPYIGLLLKNTNDKWIVVTSDPYGEGYRSGIRVGDEILKINGEDAINNRFVKKWGEAERASTIEFRKQGEFKSQTVIITPQPIPLSLFRELPSLILGFVFWFVGFITWYKRSFLEQARILFWMNWLIGLAFVLSHASSRCLFLSRELEYISISLAPIFLILFLSIFPVVNNNRFNKFAFIIACITFLTTLALITLTSLNIITVASFTKKASLVNVIIGIITMLFNLGLLIRQPKHHPGRNEAGIFLLGMGIGFFPFALLSAVPIIFNFDQFLYSQVSSLFISAVPISLYYIIVNKYLPDSRRLFLSIIINISAAIILSTVAFVVIYFLKILPGYIFEVYFVLVVFTLLFTYCFYFIRKVIIRLLEKRSYFQSERSFEQKVASINRNLASPLAEEQRLEEIIKNLNIDGIFIILENEKLGCIKKAAGRFKDNPKEREELENFFRHKQKLDLEAKMLPDDCPAGIYVPFISSDATCGVFFGRHLSRIKFEQSELPFFTLLAGQLEYQIIMSLVIGELTKEIDLLNKSSRRSQRRKMELQGVINGLFQKIERERKRLSENICSGPLQWSMDLSRWLKYLKTISPVDEKTQKVIAYLQERAEDLNYELNTLANKVGPPILTHLGLVSALQWLCQKVMTEELALISVQIQGLSSQTRFAEEVEITAYRFFEEGIINSVRHSRSHFQTVFLTMNENKLELTVSDSGRGFDPNQLENWLITGSHFGLAEIKERIESLGGELQVISGINRGTTLKAFIPISK